MVNFYAHSIEGKPVDEWHPLKEHEGTVPDLRTERIGVPVSGYGAGSESGLSPAKRRATQFADEFGCGEWGYLTGLWHDWKYLNIPA